MGNHIGQHTTATWRRSCRKFSGTIPNRNDWLLLFTTSYSEAGFLFLVIMENRLWNAARDGGLREVEEHLRNIPTVNVNWGNRLHMHWTSLHIAALNGHDPIVALLLAHPDIDVNQKDSFGRSVFLLVCASGKTSGVRLLLKDSRVKVNEPDDILGHLPLKGTAENGHIEVIKWWIASGREMDLGEPGSTWTDAMGGAMKAGKTAVVALLERFKENPLETRHAMRVNLGCKDELAAEMFAKVVFVSDGLLQITDRTPTPAARFFKIASRLPLELQMVLCSRVAGSPREIVSALDGESAFRDLARFWSGPVDTKPRSNPKLSIQDLFQKMVSLF